MKLTSILLASSALTLAAGAASAIDLTFVSWGGAYQDSQRKAYVEPYMAEHPDVKVVWDESSGEAVSKLRAMNEAGNLTWDLVDVTIADAMRLCDEGLAMEIDYDNMLAPAPDGTSASDDFGDLLLSDCFIPQIVYSITFGYRNDVAAWNGAEPTSVCDIFDLETFPGKRSLYKGPIYNMEWALYCDGVAKEDLYDVLATDEGVDRALKKLDTIKSQTVWWSAGAETPQLLADGEVVIGSTYNGRLFSVIAEQKQPVSMLWDGEIYDVDGWIIPAGLPEDRLKAVEEFLYFGTDTQRLADQAKYISYGPARASSVPLVSTHAELGIDMAPHMPNNPENATNVIMMDFPWWADHRDDLDAKFQAWLAK